MANVLLLVHRMPLPLFKGDKLRSFHLLKHLQQRHRVFLGTFIDDASDARYVPELLKLCPDTHVRRLRPWWARCRALASLPRGEALTLGYFRDRGMQRWVDATTDAYRIDATVVFTAAMAPYAPEGLPLLVDFVDLDSAKWTQYGALRRWPMSWVYAREGRSLSAYERALGARARRCFFVTPQERALFGELAPESQDHADVMRNGVDADFFAPDPGRPSPYREGERAVVFTGSMDYWPNIDGISWFVKSVLPQLLSRCPHLRLYIVGRNPAAQVTALASKQVIVTGTVADVRPYLQHAAAVVAPLRIARGIQNKILQAMAMAKPVVTVPACADAVGAGPEHGLLRAVEATQYVETLAGLLQRSTAEAEALGSSARRFVLENCRWEAHLGLIDRYIGPGLMQEEAAC